MKITLSSRAEKELNRCVEPLLVQMELVFACLTHKKLHFGEFAGNAEAVQVNDKLYVSFKPVIKKFCGVDDKNEPIFEPMTVAKRAYHPAWLKVDFEKGKWKGEFGFENKRI